MNLIPYKTYSSLHFDSFLLQNLYSFSLGRFYFVFNNMKNRLSNIFKQKIRVKNFLFTRIFYFHCNHILQSVQYSDSTPFGFFITRRLPREKLENTRRSCGTLQTRLSELPWTRKMCSDNRKFG